MFQLIKNIFEKYSIIKQFVKFCLVGFTNVFIDFSVYIVLTRFFDVQYLLANIFSFIVAVSWSFILNRTWTFRNTENKVRQQYFKFFAVSLAGLLLNTLILYTLVDFYNFYDLLAKGMAVVLVTFWNFSVNRFWTFKSERNN